MSVSIQDILPLSPQQEALLWHALRAGAEDQGVLTYGFRIEGPFRPEAFRRAWAAVLARHPLLRASFHWEGLEAPRQVIHRDVPLPWEEEDLRGLGPEAGTRQRQAFEAAPLTLTRAPLLRFRLLRLGEAEWEFLWRVHHLILDGWSVFLVLADLWTAYAACVAGGAPDLPPAPSFKAYLQWLRRRDPGQSEAFWRELLQGHAPTPAPGGTPSGRGTGTEATHLDRRTTERLRAWTAAARLTPATPVLGALGIVLAALSGRERLLLGLTVAGRPAELPDVERIVGPFTNTVPLPLVVDPKQPAAPWLVDLHALQLRLREEETAPLAAVQEWSGLGGTQPLFTTLFLYQNYPHEPAAPPDLRLHSFRWQTTTVFPLTAAAVPAQGLELYLHYDRRRYGPADARRFLAAWVRVLRALARAPEQSLGALPRPARVPQEEASSSPPQSRKAPQTPPLTAVERQVAALWEEVLGVEGVGREDNFFDLGGSSVLLMQVVQRLEKTFRIRLNPWELIFQTLGQVAALVERKLAEKEETPAGLGSRLWQGLKGAVGRRKS